MKEHLQTIFSLALNRTQFPLRRETILLTILNASLFVSSVAFILSMISYLGSILQKSKYDGDSPLFVIAFFLLFLLLKWLTKKGFGYLSAIALIEIYYIAATYMASRWGSDVPQAVLIFAVTIVISGILVSSQFAFVQTLIISISILLICQLQYSNLINIQRIWTLDPPGVMEGIMTSISLFIITIVSWLSNRELEKSLLRAEASERALRNERNQLEVRVKERTEQLEQAQLEKVTQLYRFADFGRLASGLLHDIVNPLTSVSLNIKQLASQDIPQTHIHRRARKPQQQTPISSALKRAQRGIALMEEYVKAARNQIQEHDINKRFSIKDETENVVKIFSFRQKKNKVALHINIPPRLTLHGSVISFNQALTNLLANAFDSFETTEVETHSRIRSARSNNSNKISITAWKKNNFIHLTISDNGSGILNENKKKVFEPFFSTKSPDRGTGIGLSITKKAVEEGLGGSIDMVTPHDEGSSKSTGTTFLLTFPTKKHIEKKQRIPKN